MHYLYTNREYYYLYGEYMLNGCKAPYSKCYDKGRAKYILNEAQSKLEEEIGSELYFFFNESVIWIVSRFYVETEKQLVDDDCDELMLDTRKVKLRVCYSFKKFYYEFEFGSLLIYKPLKAKLEEIFKPVLTRLEKCLYTDI